MVYRYKGIQFKYLGYLIVVDLNDIDDIERERRALLRRVNMVARRFECCYNEAKLTLFRAIRVTYGLDSPMLLTMLEYSTYNNASRLCIVESATILQCVEDVRLFLFFIFLLL